MKRNLATEFETIKAASNEEILKKQKVLFAMNAMNIKLVIFLNMELNFLKVGQIRITLIYSILIIT